MPSSQSFQTILEGGSRTLEKNHFQVWHLLFICLFGNVPSGKWLALLVIFGIYCLSLRWVRKTTCITCSSLCFIKFIIAQRENCRMACFQVGHTNCRQKAEVAFLLVFIHFNCSISKRIHRYYNIVSKPRNYIYGKVKEALEVEI